MTRAADDELRRTAQHGGTVSALVALALAEGLIDAAVLAGREDDGSAKSEIVRRAEDVAARAASKFVVSPTVAGFHLASRGEARAIGVVGTPCQALALAKMRVHPAPGDEDRVAKLKLVIGLFCGWALSWRDLRDLLESRVGSAQIRGLDIPPSGHQCLEVYTDRGTRQIPIDEVRDCVRESCAFCHDLTAELADVSVGSARSPEGWAVDRGWNHVIVRSAQGQDLLDLARQKGVLEFKEVPSGNLAKLKRAAQNKKRAARENLAQKFRGREELIYLGREES
jgi:coenzyme F420 hydrogenase subunit beta